MGSKGGGTQGYRYYMSILSGFGRGPIDELAEIVVGDKSAWVGNVCNNDEFSIDKPNLFGGDDKEGGIQGSARLLLGQDTQVVPSSIKSLIGGRVPDLLGVTTLWFDGMVSAMSPYLKVWKFRVRRSQAGWYKNDPWYPAKATIYMGGDTLTVVTSQPLTNPVSQDDNGDVLVNYQTNAQTGDSITVNGYQITFVDKPEQQGEIEWAKSAAANVARLVNHINGNTGQYKATASIDAGPQLRLKRDAATSQVHAMNGAHVLYQAYTDPLWGRGLSADDMGPSWVYAADTLCAEGFGLALIWYRKEDLSVFMQRIADLLAAVTYTDRTTGLIEIKLIRFDYDPDTVPRFTPETGLLSIEDDDSASADNSYNEIIGSSVDPVTNQKIQVRAQNPAARLSQGAVSSLDQDYKGIPTKELLARVTLRDLRSMASGLKKFTLKLDRRAWRLTPGSVIRITHPDRGLNNVILRVGEIDDGNLVNGTITVKAAIDVYGLPETSYLAPQPPSWNAPSDQAVAPPARASLELSYRDLYLRQGEPDTLALDPTFGVIGGLAQAPTALLLSYDFVANPTDWEAAPQYAETQPGQFTGVMTTGDDVSAVETVIPIAMLRDVGQEHVGQALYATLFDDVSGDPIVSEIVELISLAQDGSTCTVVRGCTDTIPCPWPQGTKLWTIDDDLTTIASRWPIGEIVATNHLTNSNQGRLDPALAGPDYDVPVVGRHALPYPPAAVRYAIGDQTPSVLTDTTKQAEPTILWSERNRVLEADKLVDWFDPAPVLAEDGTSFTLEIVGLRTVEGLTTTDGVGTFTYTADMQIEDSAQKTALCRLWAVRNGLRSYQPVEFTMTFADRQGFGASFGQAWGG